MRYSDLDRIDLDAAKEKVRQWMLAHPGGTPAPGNWTPADPPGRPGDYACHGEKQP